MLCGQLRMLSTTQGSCKNRAVEASPRGLVIANAVSSDDFDMRDGAPTPRSSAAHADPAGAAYPCSVRLLGASLLLRGVSVWVELKNVDRFVGRHGSDDPAVPPPPEPVGGAPH